MCSQESLYDCGVTADEGKAIYGAYISVLSNLEERVDFKDEYRVSRSTMQGVEKELERLRKRE